MSSRTYLSIGDVLTLLREEFPDVTISKIRFLESQGLVNPERSPSGYRKFFEHDVERLRWVLRQQREHFLPLKVIRDRLADGELEESPRGRGNGKAGEAARTPSHAAPSAADDEQPTKADEEAMARILADASRRNALMPEGGQARRGLQVVGEDAADPADADATNAATAATAATAADVAPATPAPRVPGRDEGAEAAAPAPSSSTPAKAAAARDALGTREAAARAAKAPTSPESAARPAPTSPSSSAPPPSRPLSARGSGAAGPAEAVNGMVTGASFTGPELCSASGLSPEELAGLEGFGLVCSVNVAGMQTYDEEALAVANLAAAFRAFGIEPRHLRLYRNAVDREMGLIEQVVIPLLRQRNPESRQRAVEGADQLATLGESMRASLLRQALRQHLGG